MRWIRPLPVALLGTVAIGFTVSQFAIWQVVVLQVAWLATVSAVVWADHWSAKRRKARR